MECGLAVGGFLRGHGPLLPRITSASADCAFATQPDPGSDISDACVLACIKAVEHVIKKRGLIIDAGDEIFDEYRQPLSMKGQPGVASYQR